MLGKDNHIFKPQYKNSLKYALKHAPNEIECNFDIFRDIFHVLQDDPELYSLISNIVDIQEFLNNHSSTSWNPFISALTLNTTAKENLYEQGVFNFPMSFGGFEFLFQIFLNYNRNKNPKKDYKKLYRTEITTTISPTRLHEILDINYIKSADKEYKKHIRYICKYFPITSERYHANVIIRYIHKYSLLSEYLKVSKLPIPWKELFDVFTLNSEQFYTILSITNGMRKYKRVHQSYAEMNDYYRVKSIESKNKDEWKTMDISTKVNYSNSDTLVSLNGNEINNLQNTVASDTFLSGGIVNININEDIPTIIDDTVQETVSDYYRSAYESVNGAFLFGGIVNNEDSPTRTNTAYESASDRVNRYTSPWSTLLSNYGTTT